MRLKIAEHNTIEEIKEENRPQQLRLLNSKIHLFN